MRRRDFIKGLVGSTASWPLGTYAQQSATPVVGFLHSGVEEQTTQLSAFKKGLKESGFEDGRDVSVQYRFAEGHYDRLPTLAAELVRYPVAVLFAGGGVHTALAAKSATATIPIVFANGSDPVQFGLVGSLNNPGGNITGVSFFAATLEEKRLGLLSELVPSARVFGILINPANDKPAMTVKLMQRLTRSRGRMSTRYLSRPILILTVGGTKLPGSRRVLIFPRFMSGVSL